MDQLGIRRADKVPGIYVAFTFKITNNKGKQGSDEKSYKYKKYRLLP